MIGSLFSGYGGLDMAAEALGFGPTAWHCEIEAAPAKVLAHRWPGVPNLGDITKVDWTQVEAVDVITGGFPCQDISNAGKRAGIEGARSGLWSHYADAVRVLRPRLVLVENVGALLGRGMGRVLGDLAALGYDARWVSVRASDAGAPHGRQRIFIVAAEDPNLAARGERRFAAPGQAEGGRPWADARGRGGAPSPDAERGARGERREPDPIGGRTRDAEQAGVGGVDAATDAEGDRRDEGRPESAGLERRPDAPVGGATPTAAPDAAGGGLGTRLDDDVPGRGEPDAARRGATRTAAVTDAGGARLGEHPGESPAQEAWPHAGHVAAGDRGPRADRDGREAPADADSGRRESVAELDSAASARVDGEHRGHADGRGDGSVGIADPREDADVRADTVGGLNGIAWGPYEGAIRRWESVLGRPAPRPTEPGTRGGERLSPRFVEFLMGLPAGWVTDVPGLTRNERLKMLGNGVVPQQAILAFTALLTSEVAA